MTEHLKITAAASYAEWLGTDAEMPAGQAWRAVKEADHERLGSVLDAHREAACGSAQGPIGHPVRALSAAAKMGDTLAMRMLLDAGADPTVASDGNMPQTPLYWAVEADSLGSVRLLVAAGADVNPEGEALARHAVWSADPVLQPHHKVLEYLLGAGTEPGADAVVVALDRGSPQWAGQLLAAGADPNARDTRTAGVQPLDVVLRRNANAVGPADPDSLAMRSLNVLIEAGVDVNAEIGPENMHCRPPLLAAIEAGAAWAVRPLLEKGADPVRVMDLIGRHGVRSGDGKRSGTTEAIQQIVAATRPAS